jgi:uncharacterized protein YndB with AHSA1/START domain
MHKYTRTGFIPMPPPQLFDYFTDQKNLPRWSPQVVSSEVMGGGPVQVGAKLLQKRRQGKREMVNEVAVIEHEPPKRHTVRTQVMGVQTTFTFACEPEGQGSRMSMSGEILGKGIARLWEGFFAKMIEQADDKVIDQLRDAVAPGRS